MIYKIMLIPNTIMWRNFMLGLMKFERNKRKNVHTRHKAMNEIKSAAFYNKNLLSVLVDIKTTALLFLLQNLYCIIAKFLIFFSAEK